MFSFDQIFSLIYQERFSARKTLLRFIQIYYWAVEERAFRHTSIFDLLGSVLNVYSNNFSNVRAHSKTGFYHLNLKYSLDCYLNETIMGQNPPSKTDQTFSRKIWRHLGQFSEEKYI